MIQHQVADEDGEGVRRGDDIAGVGRHLLFQQVDEAQALQDVVDERQTADPVRDELQGRALGDGSDPLLQSRGPGVYDS